MADEQTIGAHQLRIEGDTLLIRWIGIPQLEDVRSIGHQLELLLAEHGRLFIINDMRQSGLPSAKARQWLAKWALNLPITAIINFGTSLPIRALQSLIFRASMLLGNQSKVEIVHCSSEAEALAWVAARRRKLSLDR